MSLPMFPSLTCSDAGYEIPEAFTEQNLIAVLNQSERMMSQEPGYWDVVVCVTEEVWD